MERVAARERSGGILERGYKIRRVLGDITWGAEVGDILGQNTLAVLEPSQFAFDEVKQTISGGIHYGDHGDPRVNAG